MPSEINRFINLDAKPESLDKINTLLRDLPPGGGGYVVPSVQQSVGIYVAGQDFYRSPDQAIIASRENARTMLRSLDILEPLQARMLATAELDGHVEPPNKQDRRQLEVATQLQEIIDNIPFFLKYKYWLLWGIWFGRCGVQNRYYWDYSTGRRQLRVADWQPIHGDSIYYKLFSDEVAILATTNRAGSRGNLPKQMTLEPTDIGTAHVLRPEPLKLQPHEREQFVIHTHELVAGDWLEPEAAGGIKGLGIRSRVYWSWYIMHEIGAWLVNYLERVGTGFTIYKYRRGDNASLAAMTTVAQSQTTNSYILLPVDEMTSVNEDIVRVEPSPTGIDNIFKVMNEWLGRQIKRYIVGQDLSSEAHATGLGSGVADAHENTFWRIVKFDSVNLAETLTRELVHVIQKWTFPDANFKCRYVIAAEKPDPVKQLQAIKLAYDMGVSFDEDEVRGLTGCSKPSLDDAVIGGQQQQRQDVQPGSREQVEQLTREIAGDVAPGAVKKKYAKWERYEGPRGGKGWRNTETGKIVYGDRKPGGEEEGGAEEAEPEPAPAADAAHQQRLVRERGIFAQRLRDSGLDKKLAKTYRSAGERVLNQLTPTGLRRYSEGVHDLHFFASQEALQAALFEIGDADATHTQAFYNAEDMSLNLDGGKTGSSQLRVIYAHEIAHGIDGPEETYSGDPDWHEAFDEEISRKVDDPSEGWAYFGELWLGRPDLRDWLRGQFPKCCKYWEDHQL